MRLAVSSALALLLASSADLATSPITIDGQWTGSFQGGHGAARASAAATLAQVGSAVSGSVTLGGTDVAGVFPVAGAMTRGRVRLASVSGPRLRWRARWVAARRGWRGPLRLDDGTRTLRGKLTVTQDTAPAPTCGADYFAQQVMPQILEPICAQCHVPAGLARSTRLRVTVGDPVATARRAIALVDPADPAHSLLLLKPRGDVPHGGGRRIDPGSANDQILQHWIDLVTAPGRDVTHGGGPTGDLWTDNCASCHGADARGLDGRPDIHCNRGIHDAVREGRRGPTGEMPAFPNLTDADIATIQAFLVGLCPPGVAGGDELYAGNCATCHGPDAGGVGEAPSVRCATRVEDAVQLGRGARMPAFPGLLAPDVANVSAFLDRLCTDHGRTGVDLWAGNCSSCHGITAGGGVNGLGQHGPNIRCTGAGDYLEKVWEGEEGMPAFPALTPADVNAIVSFVHGTYCAGG